MPSEKKPQTNSCYVLWEYRVGAFVPEQGKSEAIFRNQCIWGDQNML